jgi:hypothetical protein
VKRFASLIQRNGTYLSTPHSNARTCRIINNYLCFPLGKGTLFQR